MRVDHAQQLQFSIPRNNRERDDSPAASFVQLLTEARTVGIELLRQFADGELVRFRQNKEVRDLVVFEPIHHHQIERRRLLPRIDELHPESDRPAPFEEILNQAFPACAHLFRDLRISVAGKVNKIEVIIDDVVVDFPGLARCIALAGKAFPIAHFVQQRRLADV